ncbi:MAG: universal stress protein [Actinomycetota bacterium]|nr:universal stress protein [Actinomycetota bacterium]
MEPARRTVLAALDASPAARPVLETARGLAEVADAAVEAVHVATTTPETPQTLAARAGVPLRLLDGPVEQSLLHAIAAPDVVAVVLGARASPIGRHPTGRTARHVIENARKPVVIVPADVMPRRPFRRLLVPLEGTQDTSRRVIEGLSRLIPGDVELELIVLHVFTAATAPRFLDHPHRDLAMLGREFIARHCPDAARIEWRTGSIADAVAELCEHQAADLVVLSWAQDTSDGHAAVIREVLGHATIPVLLIPTPVPSTLAGGVQQ